MKRVCINEQACMGCHLCEVYCQVQHSISRDPVKTFRGEVTRPLPRIRIEERLPLSVSVPCQHCDQAPCVCACLTGALTRDARTGIVVIDESRCVCCWTCLLVCPIGAIRCDVAQRRVVKCDLCIGEDVPACVVGCPNEALVYTEV